MRLGEIAERLNCRLEGDASIEIRGVAGIEVAEPGELTFLSNPRYRRALETTRASAVIVGPGVGLKRSLGLPPPAAPRSQNPYLDFALAIELFYQPPRYTPRVHPTAVVAPFARVRAGAHH